MKLRTVFLLTILLFTSQIYGQLQQISFDEKLENATTIIEGVVVESESYYGTDGEIYTTHKVEPSKIWRGNGDKNELTIITFGGQVENILATWSNCLTLQKGEQGIFFLQPTSRPNIENNHFPNNCFEVYSSKQGFLKYVTANRKQLAKEPFNSYDNIDEQVFRKIRQSTGQEIIVEHRSTIHDDNKERCIIYSFEPVESFSANGLKLSADVKVRTTDGSKSLYQSLVVLEYDTTFFGSYVATNGTLEITDGDISGSNNYALTATDLSYNKLEIKLQATNTIGLFTISETKSWLARVSLSIENIFGNPGVSFDQAAMEEGNLYHEPLSGQNKPFDCVKIENSVFPVVCPNIVSFSPDTLAAGAGDTLTIIGTNFGPPNDTLPPIGSGVLFEKTDHSGSTGHSWITPFKSEYVVWTDTLIKVIVPSLGYDLAGNITTANTPGTGIIGVMKDACIDSTATSLYIKFAAVNQGIPDGAGNPITIPNKLNNRNGNGGYDLYFTPAFQTLDTMATAAFSRALATWRCATGVNFRIRAFDSIPATYQSNACKIDYGTMPAGIPASLVAYTELDSISFCGTSSANIWHAYLKEFALFFGDSVTWHTETSMPVIDWIDTLDLETTALHELGHAHQLLHSNNAPNLMHWLANSYHRTIEPDDLAGGKHIMHISAVDTAQFCLPAMIPVPLADCGDVSTNIFDLSINNLELSVFPNPTYRFLNIEIGETVNSNYNNIRLVLFNSIGQKLSDIRLHSNKELINIESLPSGILIGVLMVDGLPTKSFKLLKH